MALHHFVSDSKTPTLKQGLTHENCPLSSSPGVLCVYLHPLTPPLTLLPAWKETERQGEVLER